MCLIVLEQSRDSETCITFYVILEMSLQKRKNSRFFWIFTKLKNVQPTKHDTAEIAGLKFAVDRVNYSQSDISKATLDYNLYISASVFGSVS